MEKDQKKTEVDLMNYNTVKAFFNKAYFNYFLILIILLIFNALLDVIGIGFIPVFISFFIDVNIFNKYIPNDLFEYLIINYKQKEIIYFVAFLLIFIFLLKNFFLIFFEYTQASIIKKIRHNVSVKVFKYFINQKYSFFVYSSKSELIRILTTDVSKSISFFVELIRFFKEVIFTVVLFGFVLFLNSFWAIIIIFSILIVVIIFFNIIKKKIKYLANTINDQLEKQYKVINEGIDSIKEIILTDKQKNIENIFKKKIEDVEKNIFLNSFLQSLGRPIFEIFSILSVIFISIYLISSDYDSKLVVPLLSLISIIIIRLIPTVNSLSRSISVMLYLFPAFKNIANILSDQLLDKGKKKLDNKENIIFDFKKISFNNVNFFHNNKKIFDNINFEIKKGEWFGVYGHSGSGKSTLLDLFSGLLDPSEGKIILNNNLDLREVKKIWQNKIGYVSQFNCFLDDTIINNITFFDDELKKTDLNEIYKVLSKVNLEKFINEREGGLDFRVGEKAIRLSGGERQRLGIARALFRRPEVIILDESTSSLNEEIEIEIMDNLKKNMTGETFVIISHKKENFKYCDKILCLNLKDKNILLDQNEFFKNYH
jgi:ABC-type multidrug transport system fused ATPase/permease subunit